MKKKNILITGISRGIGEAILKQFIKSTDQFNFYGLARKKKNIANVHMMYGNLEKEEQIKILSTSIKKLNIDILINNAGINQINNFHDVSAVEFKKILNVNLFAPYYFSQAVIKNMKKKKWGRIINISSIFGEVTKEKRSSYSISKKALHGLTKSLSVEYSKFNILTNTVSPGVIETDLTRKVLNSKLKRKEMLKKIPIGKFGNTIDISRLVYWLCSEENRYVTGANIFADGGYTNL